MTMLIRAKFRCMSVTYHAEQDSDVRLLPVGPKGWAYPDGCEENKAFWDATPSGEMKVGIKLGEPVPFQVGAFYYIDMKVAEEGWKLWEVRQHENCLTVNLGLKWDTEREGYVHASLEMTINEGSAADAYKGKVGTKWSVVITPAE